MKWWKQVIEGVGEGLPAISHTFKFGDKEWTLKIGEKEGKEGREGGREEGGDEEKGEMMEGDDEPLLSLPPATPSLPLHQPSQPQQPPSSSSSSSSSFSSSVPAGVGEGGREGMQSPLSLSGGGVGMMRRMSSSSGLATIDGSGAGGMGQWASAEEEGGKEGREGGRAGSEHVLLNVSQLRRAQQQQQEQQQQAVVTPREEEEGGGGGRGRRRRREGQAEEEA